MCSSSNGINIDNFSGQLSMPILLNESHSMYVDNTKVLRYAIVDTTICITVDT